MNTPTKVTTFTLGLIAVFGTAAGVGSAVGPIGPATAETQHSTEDDAGQAGAGAGAVVAEIPGGLMVSQEGYSLALARDSLPAGAAVPLAFRVLGPDRAPVTGYDEAHDKDLHLIVVRRDMTGFQHVHPELAEDGTWTTELALAAGQWRVFADFDPADGGAVILGTDLAVAGSYHPQPLPEPADTFEVDGYTVTFDGQLVPGQDSELTLSVGKEGRPVTDLQPYLAAYGHLVALRDGDLAYLHVHPGGEPGDGVTEPGPDITFYAAVPSAGDYRLFLDFQHEGVVRTAEFTARADGTVVPAGEQPSGNETGDHGSDDHSG